MHRPLSYPLWDRQHSVEMSSHMDKSLSERILLPLVKPRPIRLGLSDRFYMLLERGVPDPGWRPVRSASHRQQLELRLPF